MPTPHPPPGGEGGIRAEAAQAEGGAGEAGGSLRVHVHQQTAHQPQLRHGQW